MVSFLLTDCMQVQSTAGIWEAMTLTSRITERFGMTAGKAIRLRLATEEACTNAWEHGLRSGQTCFVIRWLVSESRLEVVVRQQGGAFELDPGAFVPEASRGRGLLLIRELTDGSEVRTDEEGCSLHFWMSGVVI